MSTPLEGTESAAKAIARVKYSHDAIIDVIIQEPDSSLAKLATMFGYSVPWLSRVMNSDAFQARLAERKEDLVDPMVVETIKARFEGVVTQSLEIIATKLQATQSAELALKTLDIGSRALGYGLKPTQQNNNVQQNIVITVPAKAANAEDWVVGVGGNQKVLEG